MTYLIREAQIGDLPGILEIHNDILLNTNAIWEENPADLAKRHAWMAERHAQNFPILVAEKDGIIAGFASYGRFRTNCGYDKTVEHTVHVRGNFRGHGIGTSLIETLIEAARAQGKHAMIGGIDAANEGSIRLHERFGFRESGRMKQVGFKFGKWLDLVFMQKILGE